MSSAAQYFTALALALATFAFVLGVHLGSLAGNPALVGRGCLGANGPIYADHESDFPPCLTIERVAL